MAFTHICVSLPQLPHAIVFVAPLAHDPEHAPFIHVSFVQGTAVSHWPHASHVCTPLIDMLHCCAVGVQMGVDGHEHAPQVQFVPHVCEPYELQACEAPAAHAPLPTHVPSCGIPAALHVCVSVPQLPHATGVLLPGMHDPVHAPCEQTYGHAAPLSDHVPPSLHCCGCSVLHWAAPGVHAVAQAPAVQTTGQGEPTFSQFPVASHF
jgi:hypothetical protein